MAGVPGAAACGQAVGVNRPAPPPTVMVYGLSCMWCHTQFCVDTAEHPDLRGPMGEQLVMLAGPAAEAAGWRPVGSLWCCPKHAELPDS